MHLYVKNLTGKKVVIRVDANHLIMLDPEVEPARARNRMENVANVTVTGGTIRLYDLTDQEVTGLPAPEPGWHYLVDLEVAQLEADRPDLLIVGPVAEGGEPGQVLGVCFAHPDAWRSLQADKDTDG